MSPQGSSRSSTNRRAWLGPRLWVAAVAGVLAAGASLIAYQFRFSGPVARAPVGATTVEPVGEPWPVGREVEFEVTFESNVAGDVPILVDLHTNPERANELRQRLRQRMVLRMAGTGRFEGVAFPHAARGEPVDAVARGSLRTLAAGLQMARGVPDPSGTWSVVERDVTGSYRASYERRSPTEYRKRKLAYVAIRHGVDAGARTVVDVAEAKLVTEGAFGLDRLLEFDSNESTHTTGAGVFPEFRSRLRLTATRVAPVLLRLRPGPATTGPIARWAFVRGFAATT